MRVISSGAVRMMDYISRASSDYQSPYGFRLQHERERERDVCSSRGSVASYKQRIDSMFDESQPKGPRGTSQRPTCRSESMVDSDGLDPLAGTLIETDSKQLVKNMVQARIEKMFEEVEGDGEGKTQRSKLDPSTFQVDYLGSLPLTKKVSSLEGLQEPLKDLYLNYKQLGNIRPVFQDVLEISNCGLKVKYTDEKQDELVEQLNPFPTIAVWAAVKFVCRPRGLDHGKEFGLEYAFMPLISDPESVDKVTLFTKLTPNEACYFTGDYYSDHSPMFVAVMRKMGVSRQLECHGFVCNSNENAIVIAANLYKALVITMAKNQSSSDEKGKKRNLKHKNGLSTVCSVGGSSLAGDFERLSVNNDSTPPKLPPANQKNNVGQLPHHRVTQNKLPVKKPPPRPPKKAKSPVRNRDENVILQVKHPDPDEILQLSSPPPSQSPQLLKSNSFNFSSGHSSDEAAILNNNPIYNDDNSFESSTQKTKPNESKKNFGGNHNSFCAKEYTDRGDILTKVAIPRSQSFLNANGPLSSRYNRHSSVGPLLGNAIQRKNSVGSPLGLNELFTEFRLQEGLNNMEDILNAIIDSDGMSFNDLKPIYKEFLLKLAVTLTKDEIYQRSKSIMQRQKNRKKKITRRSSCKLKKTFIAGGGFRKAFRRSLLKLKFNKTKPNSFEFSSVLFPSCTRVKGKKSSHRSNTYLKSYGFPYTSSSNESSLLPHNRRRSPQSQQKGMPPSGNLILSDTKPTTSNVSPLTTTQHKERRPGNSVSEDSDFFSLTAGDPNGKAPSQHRTKTQGGENCLHQASSGYFSCSDCSYDSESCTCMSADKCYCSMGNKQPAQPQGEGAGEGEERNVSLTSCECDTDSCFESDKCYCDQRRGHRPSLFEQLKQQGFAASESSLSRANSPTTAWHKNEAEITGKKAKNCKRNKGELQASKSLEFLKVRPRHNSMSQLPLESYHNNIYQSPVEAIESEYQRGRQIKSSFSSSPITSSSESKSNKSLHSARRSYSSDNLALDYNLFSTNSKVVSDEDTPSEDLVQQRKVLVVSTRDPKGRIIYMSASQRCQSPMQIFNSKRDNIDPLSVKKSAEIAALFSNVKFNNRTSCSISRTKEEVIYNTLEPPDYFLVRGGSNCMKKTSLENSLGYFP